MFWFLASVHYQLHKLLQTDLYDDCSTRTPISPDACRQLILLASSSLLIFRQMISEVHLTAFTSFSLIASEICVFSLVVVVFGSSTSVEGFFIVLAHYPTAILHKIDI